jgi:hypothetical protein
MHFEHENLNREYANKETMILSSPIIEIPREEFYVTEDNYAWDLSELVEAIVSNGGVMRNPLNKQMFTPKDIQAILKHPRGKKLAALQVEQQQLSRGVRKETIAWIEKLARSMKTERGRDWDDSWELILEFQRYVARRKFSLSALLYGTANRYSQYPSGNKRQSVRIGVRWLLTVMLAKHTIPLFRRYWMGFMKARCVFTRDRIICASLLHILRLRLVMITKRIICKQDVW